MVPGADAELTPVLRLGAGAVAGIIAMSATYPMDMIRGRLTVQVPRNRLQGGYVYTYEYICIGGLIYTCGGGLILVRDG